MRKGWLLILGASVGVCSVGCDDEKAPATQVAPLAEVKHSPGPVTRARLSVMRAPEHGPYIADSSGRALYILSGEAAGKTGCYAGCAQVWRPFIVSQSRPESAPGVDGSLIGTARRRDGSIQATYNGHPLYYYVRDLGPGRTTGQHVSDAWGEWYLLTPQGGPLDEHESVDARMSVVDNRTVLESLRIPFSKSGESSIN